MAEKHVDIHKAGGIIILDRRALVARSHGKDIFNTPGGKLEGNETSAAALIRELHEEITITVQIEDLEEFGTFYAEASGQRDKSFRMDVFLVNKWTGDISPSNEIAELKWVNSTDAPDVEIGSVFMHDVLPRLRERNLID